MIPIAKPIIGKEEKLAVLKVLKSGHLIQGKMVEQFEKSFSDYIGAKHAVAVNSGTSGLYLALLVHDIGRDDEVITTPFSFISTANAILFVGATPVFADIGDDFNIDPQLVEKKITSRTKAIIPVHLYGYPADMESLTSLAKKHHLVAIEDACQAHGAEIKGKKVGSFGTGVFSFYATKNMTTAEGGMITTNNSSIAEKLKLLRSHGSNERGIHALLGYNFRMTDLAAALGLEQLKRLEKFNRKRIRNAKFFSKNIKVKGIILPKAKRDFKHVYYQYTLRIIPGAPKTRDKLREILKQRGIESAIYYPQPIYKQVIYKNLGFKNHLSKVEEICREVLSIPVHPSLSTQELNYIVKVINSIKD